MMNIPTSCRKELAHWLNKRGLRLFANQTKLRLTTLPIDKIKKRKKLHIINERDITGPLRGVIEKTDVLHSRDDVHGGLKFAVVKHNLEQICPHVISLEQISSLASVSLPTSVSGFWFIDAKHIGFANEKDKTWFIMNAQKRRS